MGAKKITPELKQDIIQYLKDHSQYKAAKHFKISPSTVNGIAKENPEIKNQIECSGAKNQTAAATEAHKAYAKSERLAVLHKLMGKIEESLDSDELRPGNLRDLSIALGTTLDKYRLEEKEDPTGKDAGEIRQLFDKMKEEGKTHAENPPR